ncbi:type II secretion system F family protein [Methanoregula sp.]|uniref:type II secretion system F family protein n=1 Tax=Methanoregula sp. TaxID=2052170 RepID=UPI003C748D8A
MREKIDQKIEELKEIVERIRIIYNPPREYFTIVLPVVLALLLIIGAVLVGYTFQGTEKQQAQGDSARLEQLKALQAQMDDTGGAAAENSTPKTPAATQKMGLDEIMVFAVLIAITPYAIDITLQKRSTRRKEELYTEFLFKLSELMRGGLDPIKSVKELSRTDLGILTPHIRIASTSMIYGKSFEESMKSMAKSLNSELIARYTTLVIQASYSGGSVADLILKASEDMRSIISIEREKEGNLSQYVMIFYFAQGIILFIIYTLSTSLLPFVKQLGSTSIFGGANQIANLDFSRGFFHMIMINSFFGGLIIGKISEGDARFGLKHAVVLMIFGYIACALFILPPPATPGQNLKIMPVVNESISAYPSVPLKDPVSFMVTDTSGNPVNSTVVQFSIVPSGSVSPTSDTSDDQGIVKTKVTVGDVQGTYIVIASANGATTRQIIVASGE